MFYLHSRAQHVPIKAILLQRSLAQTEQVFQPEYDRETIISVLSWKCEESVTYRASLPKIFKLEGKEEVTYMRDRDAFMEIKRDILLATRVLRAVE